MIGAAEVRERAREWSLREHVVEKDYVLGWFLWAIATEPVLSAAWVFKGGTCLKKCYFETYRFSEDLDFTARDERSLEPDALRRRFADIGERIYEACGIEVPRDLVRFEAYTTRRGRRAVEGRVSYRGPLQPRGDLPRLKLDLTADEILVQEAVPRVITHPFTDTLGEGAVVQCYSMAEVFGEKIRALSERCLPRDLYDVVTIHRHTDLGLDPDDVHGVLERKCAHKNIAVPTLDDIMQMAATGELAGEWDNMLRHQLPDLPPFDAFLVELEDLFVWLTPIEETQAPRVRTGRSDARWNPGWRGSDARPAAADRHGMARPRDDRLVGRLVARREDPLRRREPSVYRSRLRRHGPTDRALFVEANDGRRSPCVGRSPRFRRRPLLPRGPDPERPRN